MEEMTRELEAILLARQLAWSDLGGCEVRHSSLGVGRIVRCEERSVCPSLVVICFGNEEDEKKFTVDEFFTRFDVVTLSEPVQRAKSEWARIHAAVEEGRATLARYSAKYSIPLKKLLDQNGPTEYGCILLKVHDRAELNEREIAVLRRAPYIQVLQQHYRHRAEEFLASYQRSHDEWDLVNACKCLRAAGAPNEAVAASDAALGRQARVSRARAALLTTRGGSSRDLGELTDARRSAELALELEEEDRYAETLLGAICFMEGRYDQGIEHFRRAKATPRDEEEELRRVLREVPAPTRKEIVAYLLKRSPVRFEWASRV